MQKLIDIIQQGESETQEFKPAFNTDVIETAVAFANTRGGRILIGLSDAGQSLRHSVGKEALRDYVNRIATATEPTIIPDAEKTKIDDGDVIILSIPEFPLKPVSTRGRCYRRSGSTTHQMTPAEIAEMHLRSTGQSMDAIIVPGRGIDDLNLDAVRSYMHRATAQGRRSFTATQDPQTVLRKLDLIKSENEITRAAILLFGKEPQSPLGQAVVHAGRLREKTHIMDNAILDGSIIDQVEATVSFIKKNLHVRFEITGEPERKEIWDYPLPAIREAVTNAICHRDYGNTTDIQIKIFEDRLLIWSPGQLPFDVTVEDLLNPTHTSKPRNKLIAQIFFDMGIIERYGGGIQRILDHCNAQNLSSPILENSQGGFSITFQSAPPSITKGVNEGVTKGVNEGVNELFELLKRTPGLRAPKIAEKMQTSPKNIERWIKQLKNEGRIEFRGVPKTGGYYLIEN